MPHHRCLIIGAGPGGLAVAAALHEAGVRDVVVLDKGVIGQAWLDYPAETRLLSETTNRRHDDNMIAGVSVADVFPHIPHPNHLMYQKYLEAVVEQFKLDVRPHHKVKDVTFDSAKKLFRTSTNHGTWTSQFVVWAAGMYSTPNEQLPGRGCFIHYARILDLEKISDQDVTVVGSSNGASGVVMALARPGRTVRLVCSQVYEVPQPVDCLWKEQMAFIQELERQGLVTIVENFRVKCIDKKKDDQYCLTSADGHQLTVPTKPIVCIGFLPNVGPIAELVDQVCEHHDTMLLLDRHHQSHKQPGLFVAGTIGRLVADESMIRHFRHFGRPIATEIKRQLSHHAPR